MKTKRFFLFAVMVVSAAAILTSCEDILGQWDRPSGAVTSLHQSLLSKKENT